MREDVITCLSCSTLTFSLPLLLLISLITFHSILISSSFVLSYSLTSESARDPPSLGRRVLLMGGGDGTILKLGASPWWSSPWRSASISCCIASYIWAQPALSFSISSFLLSSFAACFLRSTSASSSLFAKRRFSFSSSNSCCLTTLTSSSL